MKVLIDTNIIISAILFPKGIAAKAFVKSLVSPFEPIISDYIINELNDKFNEKFSTHIDDLKQFLSVSLEIINVITTPQEINSTENYIRDIKDQPILRSAIMSNVDFILTGDKDFLEANIKKPIGITVE